MDLSTTLSLVQTILAAIQTLGQLQAVCSVSNCKSELDDLQNTVQTVRAVLEDADAKQDLLSSQDKNYIQELKDAVYDADDVFDEFLTLSKQKQLKHNKLWMAQGYITSENLGEEYFLILLQRCFFQDILKDKFGGIESFKIHDLLHDTAEKVAGEEICRFNYDTSNVGRSVRHLSFVSVPHAQHIFNSTHIRTCLQIEYHSGECRVDQLLESKTIMKWTCLRSLDLSYTDAKRLPESIGQLLHLRSLDLSFSFHLKVLPKSITKLVNLQTLNLQHCAILKQVPDDVSKLVDLSTLNVAGCNALRCMPANISMLTCLHTLCEFVVGVRAKANSTLWQCFNGLKDSNLRQCFNGLEDLQHLDKLRGCLMIHIAVLKNAKFVKEEHGGGGYLRRKKHLETIGITFKRGEEYGSKESEQALLEEMKPHRDVKALELKGYHGETIPRWLGRGDNSALFDFPNLVTLSIFNCSEMLYLPWQIGKLPRLKTLSISGLWNMEYVADANSETLVSCEGSSLFPSLDILSFDNLPKLKGWWRRSESGSHVVNPNDSGSSREANLEWISSPCFPVLRKLTLQNCKKMIFVPLCPQLEDLTIHDSIIDMRCILSHQPPLSYPKLKRLKINNLKWLESTPIEYSQFLVEIVIDTEERMVSLGELNEFPAFLLSSVRTLLIKFCPKLVSVRGWLEHLSALEYLTISLCRKVDLGGMSWHNLAGSLQHLELTGVEEMEELPEGMQYCTSLRILTIWYWPKLKYLPNWMPKLTSLLKLELWNCSESLFERCQQPNGEDWPLIRHISKLEVW
ncbi:disease resistance protein RGA2-like isoform X1 [Silene latifolia]|uniref:disease resistance protein RGA2-like isoform X1 n=1 Tax=Silene latifolia TaxID=37657 RepID=UPI003D787C62